MTKGQIAYRRYSRIYDQFHERRLGEDIRFWQNAAQNTGSPVLELGCGSGRLCLPIARLGISIHGIDNSAEMLQLLEQKSMKESQIAQSLITWEFGDMRSFEAQTGKYRMVFVACSALQYLHNKEDQQVVFSRAHQALEDDGVFIVEVFNPNPEFIKEWGKPLFIEGVKGSPSNDGYIQWFCVPESYDGNSKILTMPNLFRIHLDNVSKPEVILIPAQYYCFSTDELETLFKQAGFGNIQTFGDYDKSPFTRDSRRILMIGLKKK